MRGSGGRTRYRDSLRGHPKRMAGNPRAQKPAIRPAVDRTGSDVATSDPRRHGPTKSGQAVNRPKSKSATAVAVASVTSSSKSTLAKKNRKHLEAFLPEQRHMFGEERVFLPCPVSPR